ncbi:hypothetical protein SDC9_118929 [bioreactor metagenome]|uniref:Uncharacterized protein n=1 Tax=bioreactor metagenome TaxID=1076179 RepID=A0A645C423_9ZZZZ
MHQALRHEIKRGKAVADDRLQFAIQSRLHHLRQRVAVNFVRFADRHITQNIFCVLNRRRMRSVGKRLQQIAALCDSVGFFYHDAQRSLFAQIGKFFEHLLRGLEIQRSLKRSIVKPVFCENDFAVDRILRVEKMHVSRCDNGNSQAVAQRDDLAVDLENPFIGRLVFTHQKGVVAARLNL